jgi:membrane protein DedA with SNARE-associated domain
MSGSAAHLPGFLDSLRPVLDQYGYLAVTGFVLLEDFGVPVPGETILILGAVYAGTGRLQIWLVGVLGFLGAVIGDNVGFAIGHFGGRRLVERYGRYVFLTPERLNKTTNFFERRGARIIIIARFIEGLRQANGIIAGISGMHWARFVAYNAIGAALWVAVWACVGYFSGNHLTSIYNAFTSAGVYALIAAGVLLAAYIARRVMRTRRRRAERAGAETERTMPAADDGVKPADDALPAEQAAAAAAKRPEADASAAKETAGEEASATEGPVGAESSRTKQTVGEEPSASEETFGADTSASEDRVSEEPAAGEAKLPPTREPPQESPREPRAAEERSEDTARPP